MARCMNGYARPCAEYEMRASEDVEVIAGQKEGDDGRSRFGW